MPIAVPTSCHLRSIRSAKNRPSAAPTGASKVIIAVNASEWAIANPWRTSMIGTQVMNPNAAIVWQNWNNDSMMVRRR